MKTPQQRLLRYGLPFAEQFAPLVFGCDANRC
jgi:hypothetical protein